MVNCKNCGAPLSLEEAVCPHCGTPNPEAQEHLKQLAQLNSAFEQTQYEVVDEVKKNKRGYGVLVILVMVMLANLILIPVHAASYDIAEKLTADKRGKDDILATLDTLMEEGEYIEMFLFSDRYRLNYRDYGEYNQINYLASDYNRVVNCVTNYLYGKDNYSDPLVQACDTLIQFKNDYDSYSRRMEDQRLKGYLDKLNAEMDAYVKTFLKLSDEDIAGFADMSNSELLLKVNERLTNEEE